MTEPPERESHMSGTNDEKKVGTSPHSFDLVLPQGVTDLGDWGVTVLGIGKYGKMGYSYMLSWPPVRPRLISTAIVPGSSHRSIAWI